MYIDRYSNNIRSHEYMYFDHNGFCFYLHQIFKIAVPIFKHTKIDMTNILIGFVQHLLIYNSENTFQVCMLYIAKPLHYEK